MSGNSIQIASKALKLFLQSLPVGSFYQIIGFGSDYKKYDEIPKEYTKENIIESLKIINKLEADLGGTNIYSPLKDIYDSFEIYDSIKLSKNIFLLTDGVIENKENTLSLIENNNNNFSIYSIGVGNYFDKNLIENAGIIGKGHYNFCPNLLELNKIITSEINSVTQPYISHVNIISPLDNNNKVKQIIKNNLKENEIMKLNYICDKNEINIGAITFEMNYYIKDKKYQQLYEIVPNQLPKGEELSKLIIYDNILKKQLKKYDKENLSNALKYQIFYKNTTSLYAELELSNKIEEKMKLKIIGDKENNIIEMFRKKRKEISKKKEEYREEEEDDIGFGDIFGYGGGYQFKKEEEEEDFSLGCKIDKGRGRYHPKEEEEEEDIACGDIFDGVGGEEEFKCKRKEDNKEEENEEKPNLNDKDYIMILINTQDFIEGYWEENEKTKNIKIKYDKEFNLLKNNNFSDNVSITVLIIYFINKEHPELLDELLMIIKKAKEFIKKSTNSSYENIINKININ